ncbi:MAG TPA: hypothetical protein VL498_07060 [Terracidiphilus sp.]|jgi:hypothetical protein|nr:hypothetical protein [Terracidiphilus sp.]
MGLRTTHTYVKLEVCEPAYREIRAKLFAAGYSHAFEVGDSKEHGRGPIDMTGIAVIPEPMKKRPGTTTVTHYGCGHVLSETTNPVVYDPAGLLCETQISNLSDADCGHCAEIEAAKQ